MVSRINILSVVICCVLLQFSSGSWCAAPPNSIPSDANGNTAGGTQALLNNGASATYNTGFGQSALKANKTGVYNTASGAYALSANTTGLFNTASGFTALLSNTTGYLNTANGSEALRYNTTGINNTATGFDALYYNTTGSFNTASGTSALISNTTGNSNTTLGYQTLYNNTTSNGNTAIGINAGYYHITGNNNVYIANVGGAVESSTIRLGSFNHTRTFIGGIRGKKTDLANAVLVVIDNAGQLGTINSSARFKKDINDMASASQALYKLRPVTYRYKEADDNGTNPIEYGLIAEEVAKVYPDLVAYGADGQIETVQYHKLTPMLLNELIQVNNSLQTAVSKSASLADQLKTELIKNQQLAKEVAGLKAQSVKVVALEQQVAALQTQAKAIETLTARLSRLEVGQMTALNH
jgi:hypothetical protein